MLVVLPSTLLLANALCGVALLYLSNMFKLTFVSSMTMQVAQLQHVNKTEKDKASTGHGEWSLEW